MATPTKGVKKNDRDDLEFIMCELVAHGFTKGKDGEEKLEDGTTVLTYTNKDTKHRIVILNISDAKHWVMTGTFMTSATFDQDMSVLAAILKPLTKED